LAFNVFLTIFFWLLICFTSLLNCILYLRRRNYFELISKVKRLLLFLILK
jgi:hypothetical protein